MIDYYRAKHGQNAKTSKNGNSEQLYNKKTPGFVIFLADATIFRWRKQVLFWVQFSLVLNPKKLLIN